MIIILNWSTVSFKAHKARHHDAVNGKILTVLQIRTRAAKRALAVRGMMEAVTWSFIPAKHAELFGGGQTALKLANPIAADMSDMRPSLLPGLIAAAQRNADKGIGDVALFEVSGTYEGDGADQQRRVAAGVRRGTAKLDGINVVRVGTRYTFPLFARKYFRQHLRHLEHDVLVAQHRKADCCAPR